MSLLEVKQLRRTSDALLSDYKLARRQLSEEKLRKEKLRHAQSYLEEAQKAFQTVAQGIQKQLHKQIAGVVTRCLQSIFDDPYTFHILFEKKRGKTEARLVFRRRGLEINPRTAAGGGVLDVAAFSLMLACLMLLPENRRLLIQDEPFKMLSSNYRPRVRQLLMTLAKEMGIQIVMVTHDTELICGKPIQIGEET